jgi:hypothetical protein
MPNFGCNWLSMSWRFRRSLAPLSSSAAFHLSMERFTKFRDPGTGIAPFLPIAPASRTPLTFPLELTLFVFRIPVLVLVFGLEVVFAEIVGEAVLRNTVPRLLGWIKWMFLRTILFLCGILMIDEQLEGVTKACVPSALGMVS